MADITKYFTEKCSDFKWIPRNTPRDYEIIMSINREMDDVRRDFQEKVELSNQLCSNFRFSRC